jgi:hypothetical protein
MDPGKRHSRPLAGENRGASHHLDLRADDRQLEGFNTCRLTTAKGKNIENASILRYNIKAAAKPFMILHPAMAKVGAFSFPLI